MLFKLSIKNQKKSIKDYSLYFFTLILGIAIFYIFNAVEAQTSMMELSQTKSQIIGVMNSALEAMSVLVSFILGFLIAYASQFLIKKRKKEFGLYLLLGMKKINVCMIIFFETVIIGFISLLIGLILGISLSQFMSLFVASLFEANMQKFVFVVSSKAIIKTILYFILIFIFVTVMDLIIVSKAKLIDLLTAHYKKEKNMIKNPYLSFVLFIAACLMLAYAYYNVTVKYNTLTSQNDVQIQIILGIIGTFLIFYSISGFVLAIIKKIPNIYHRHLNSFVVSEIGNKINSTVISGSIICLLLFMTICLLSSSFSLKRFKENSLKDTAPISASFSKKMDDSYSIKEIFNKQKIDTSIYKNSYNFYTYTSLETTIGSVLGNYGIEMLNTDPTAKEYLDTKLPIINESTYNKVAKLYNNKTINLNKDEYQIIGNNKNQMHMFNDALKQGNQTIAFMNQTLHAKYNHTIDGFLMMNNNACFGEDCFGFIIIPDEFDLNNLSYSSNYLLVPKMSDENNKYISSSKFDQTINPETKEWQSVLVSSQTDLYDESIGSSGVIIFVSLYLGFIFMISGAALLALKEMSDAIDNKNKYEILRKIGTSNENINNALFKQMLVFFGFPLLLAIIHSIFGIQVCNIMLEIYNSDALLQSILITAGMIIVIYGGYFLVSYLSCKRVIK
ncbi:MAG: ABC transporter permease [[Clostridium] spiroforme]|uniref:ABC transporter permease n=1 Tax=Thomasclavelia spiroformis TaxID=29348 RepID=A0A943EKA1_9FIRM|nr:ABC transporter permease [Thomasclavelia spiroformis]MBS5588252.1 ABC transporter permease [Thomasclavelia spiroformis]